MCVLFNPHFRFAGVTKWVMRPVQMIQASDLSERDFSICASVFPEKLCNFRGKLLLFHFVANKFVQFLISPAIKTIKYSQ